MATTPSPLLPTPATLVAPDGRLHEALTVGALQSDPLVGAATRGRTRRWSYAAAADDDVAVGVALVDLGAAGTVFAWVHHDDVTRTWERRVFARRGAKLTREPGATASYRRPGAVVDIAPDGGIRLDVVGSVGRLTAHVEASGGTPAVLATRTAGGGWNVTQKHAGYRVHGTVTVDGATYDLDGAGWSDRTTGRQDRHTLWRWASAAGVVPDGRRVGLNASTGMNAAGPGENVVWWDGTPYPLGVDALAPQHGPEGVWTLAGEGWELLFEPQGVRAACENLLIVRSRYVQPVGRFRGTLPGPDGRPVDIGTLPGVTEEHDATW